MGERERAQCCPGLTRPSLLTIRRPRNIGRLLAESSLYHPEGIFAHVPGVTVSLEGDCDCMALTDQEHTRLQTLRDEMIGLVGSTDSDPAAAAYGKIARVCREVLSREASARQKKEDADKLKEARKNRETRRGANGGSRASA